MTQSESSEETLRPVDAWVNLDFALPDDARFQVGFLFGGIEERLRRGTGVAQLVEVMDENGIDRAVLTGGFLGRTLDDLPALEAARERHPDRFALSVVVDPRRGMEAVRAVRSAVTQHGVRLVRMLAYETQLPYDHAIYFPVYAACAELGVPVGLNVGLPGPRVAGECQHPLPIDAVCAFFPELTIVMSHGGEPWVDVCVKLLAKWPNLHYMTSAFTSRRIPTPIIELLNTRRGRDKIMWASDYPVIDVARSLHEMLELPIRDRRTRHQFARGNALRLFFGDETVDV